MIPHIFWLILVLCPLWYPPYVHSHNTLIWKWVVGFKNINSFAPDRMLWNFREVRLKLIFLIDGTRIPCEMAPRWMALDFTNEKSSLVQVIASCRRVHTFISPCGVTRPQLVRYILEIDGLVQDNSNCIADALELLQPYTKSWMC